MQNGKFSAAASLFVKTLKNVDFLGKRQIDAYNTLNLAKE